jgi:hypothetical protein
MNKLAADNGAFMAEEAEISPRRAQLEFIRGLVGVVASRAFPLFHGGVDELF